MLHQFKSGILTPWVDIVMYMKQYPNWFRGSGGVSCQFWFLPLTLVLASNNAYCATAHRFYQAVPMTITANDRQLVISYLCYIVNMALSCLVSRF